MADTFYVHVRAAELGRFVAKVEETGKQALRLVAAQLLAQVRDFTPRFRGGMVAGIQERPEDGGRTRVVFGRGVVVRVHESNAQWSRMPPHRPIRDWVVGKLGIPEAQADSVAYRIRRKIRRRGLTLPNVEGRGKMFQRTSTLMRQTRAHLQTFKSAFRLLLGA